ncbi:MAG: winged helix-turn-helix domain-containing protein [Defluviitaleaceae bacterium]|nr:winged helix-turn-helix domain-containing protein [Defluviitaleaceae bacterium]
MSLSPLGYEAYVKIFDALSHPMRIKIIGILHKKRRYVSELAKLVNMSRPLLYMHLKKLEEADIIDGTYEISESGKTMRFYELKSFDIRLTPEILEELGQGIDVGG